MEIDRVWIDEAEELTPYAMDIVIDQRIDPRRFQFHEAPALQRAFNQLRSRQLDDVAFYSGTQWRLNMKRKEWTVPYRGDTLAVAAAAKKDYHAGRQKWWSDKRAEVIEKIKAEGISVTDSIVDELSKTGYANTGPFGNAGPTVQIDAALQHHLAEAHGKMHEHERLAKEYEAWRQMMESHPQASFDLQQDDWMFFFGK